MLKTWAFVILAAAALGISASVAGLAPASANVSYFSFASFASPNLGRCLGIPGNGNAGIFNCTYADDQKWHRGNEKGTTSFYQFINNEGQCLGVAGGSEDAGAQVIGFRCDGSDSQYWHTDFISTTSYICYVYNYHSSYVLQPMGTVNGSLVKQQPHNQNDIQKWVFVSDSN